MSLYDRTWGGHSCLQAGIRAGFRPLRSASTEAGTNAGLQARMPTPRPVIPAHVNFLGVSIGRACGAVHRSRNSPQTPYEESTTYGRVSGEGFRASLRK